MFADQNLQVIAAIEHWPLRAPFVISRATKTEATLVTVTLSDGAVSGRGECVPYPRYDETPEQTCQQIEQLAQDHKGLLDRTLLQSLFEPGAARNALDCALWSLQSARTQTRVWDLAGLPAPGPINTCQTVSLATPEQMAAEASTLAEFPILKVKLGAEGDTERMHAVRCARPDARLIGDANEGWAGDTLEALLKCAAEHNFETIEQPLPAAEDHLLGQIPHPLPICADESVHTTADLSHIAMRYDAINIKLDKTGGLTEAIRLAKAARRTGLKIMLGSMVCTSLSIAPALLLAPFADWIDLDGPLLLSRDRDPGLTYRGPTILPPSAGVWG